MTIHRSLFWLLMISGTAFAQQTNDSKTIINQNDYSATTNLQNVESTTLFPKDGVTPNLQDDATSFSGTKSVEGQSIIPAKPEVPSAAGQTIFSNEVTSKQIGNQIIYSNGVVCTQIGSQLTCINE